MECNNLNIEQKDFVYLKGLLEISKYNNFSVSAPTIEKLEQNLKEAKVFQELEISNEIIRFNSTISLVVDHWKELTVELVKSIYSDNETNRVSVLTPLGSALIGRKTGDQIEWDTPSGTRTIRILKVKQQKESQNAVPSFSQGVICSA